MRPMDNGKWPAVRGWLPDRQPPGGGMYPGVDDFPGTAGGPPAGGGFFGGPSGYGGGPFGGPTGYGGGYSGGSPAGYSQPYGGGGLFGLPFNLGQLKAFVDRMGGLDGILNTIGKMQKLFGTMQQLAPLMRLLLAKKSSTADADADLEIPRRRRKRSGGRGARHAAGRGGRHRNRVRRGAGRRPQGGGRRRSGGYARVRAADGPAGKRTGRRDRFRLPEHGRDPDDLPPHGLFLP